MRLSEQDEANIDIVVRECPAGTRWLSRWYLRRVVRRLAQPTSDRRCAFCGALLLEDGTWLTAATHPAGCEHETLLGAR